MKLKNQPFQKMKNGLKTIELRLFDEKRQQLHSGQIVHFINEESNECLKVRVLDLHIYPNFKKLYENLDLLVSKIKFSVNGKRYENYCGYDNEK